MRLSRPRMVRPHLSNLHTIIRITILNIIGPLVCIPHSHLSHYHVIYFGILVNILISSTSIQSLSSFTKIGALDAMMYNGCSMYPKLSTNQSSSKLVPYSSVPSIFLCIFYASSWSSLYNDILPIYSFHDVYPNFGKD